MSESMSWLRWQNESTGIPCPCGAGYVWGHLDADLPAVPVKACNSASRWHYLDRENPPTLSGVEHVAREIVDRVLHACSKPVPVPELYAAAVRDIRRLIVSRFNRMDVVVMRKMLPDHLAGDDREWYGSQVRRWAAMLEDLLPPEPQDEEDGGRLMIDRRARGAGETGGA